MTKFYPGNFTYDYHDYSRDITTTSIFTMEEEQRYYMDVSSFGRVRRTEGANVSLAARAKILTARVHGIPFEPVLILSVRMGINTAFTYTRSPCSCSRNREYFKPLGGKIFRRYPKDG